MAIFLLFVPSFLIQVVWLADSPSMLELLLYETGCVSETAIQQTLFQMLYSFRKHSFIEGNILRELRIANCQNKSCTGVLNFLENIIYLPSSINKNLILAILIRESPNKSRSKLLMINFLRQETLFARYLGRKLYSRFDYLTFISIVGLLGSICAISESFRFAAIQNDIFHFREAYENSYLQPNLGKFLENLFPEGEISKLKRSKKISFPPEYVCSECIIRWNIYISKILKKPIVDLESPFQDIFIELSENIKVELWFEIGEVPAWTLLQCAYLSDFFLVLTSLEDDFKRLGQLASVLHQKLTNVISLVWDKTIKLRFE